MGVLDLKPGTIFEYEGKMYTVMSTMHTQQQQRRGLVRCKAKELDSGKTIEHVWRSDVQVKEIRADEVPMTYQYRDTNNFHFMDEASYEQVVLPAVHFGETSQYLSENLSVVGLFYEGKLLDIQLPMNVELKVTEAEPGFKGDTVTGGRKRAVLETGLVVQVPLFIEPGDRINVDTRTGEYVTRVSA
jgi:elongation factor P